MGHNCVEGPDTQQWQHPAAENKWIAPEAGVAGVIAHLCSARHLPAVWQINPRGGSWLLVPGAPLVPWKFHCQGRAAISLLPTQSDSGVSRGRVTCRDVTAWHVVTSRATPFVTSPLITRHPGHGRHGLTDWQTQNWSRGSKLYRDLSPQLRGTRDPRPGRVGGGTHGGFGSAHVETGHIFDFPVRWHNTWWSITASYLDRGIPSHNHTAGR